MKLIAFLVIFVPVLCVQVQADKRDDFRAKFRVDLEKCIPETNASDADVENLYNYRRANSREGRCLDGCLMREFNVVDDNGRLKQDEMRKIITDISLGDEKEIREGGKTIDICKNLPIPRDKCDSSQVYIICFKNEADRRGIDFVFIWTG